MQVNMKQVAKVMTYFNKLQKHYGHTEQGNVLQQKWDMRSIIEAMPSSEDLQQLMQFFMLTSDDRSFQHFSYKYHEYYETMLKVKEDRLTRRYLQQETLARTEGDKKGE